MTKKIKKKIGLVYKRIDWLSENDKVFASYAHEILANPEKYRYDLSKEQKLRDEFFSNKDSRRELINSLQQIILENAIFQNTLERLSVMDYIQEFNNAIPETIKKYKPLESSFKTWFINKINWKAGRMRRDAISRGFTMSPRKKEKDYVQHYEGYLGKFDQKTPEEITKQRDLKERVMEGIENLKPKIQDILTKAILNNSTEEIMRQTGYSRQEVKRYQQILKGFMKDIDFKTKVQNMQGNLTYEEVSDIIEEKLRKEGRLKKYDAALLIIEGDTNTEIGKMVGYHPDIIRRIKKEVREWVTKGEKV